MSRMQTKWQNLIAVGQTDDDLFREIYLELKKIARSKVAWERPGITLNATALVHEAWLRLEKSAPEQWRDHSQFFASAAEAMRRILVEAARQKSALKRGSGEKLIPIDGIDIPDPSDDQRLLEVHQVLDELAAVDEIKATIVKMRYFCGMENEEIASILGVNEKTVRRHWALAKAWLYRAILQGSHSVSVSEAT